jgi:long-chain fatty acid transport protein
VRTININPAVAYKLNNHLSIGAGVSAQYVDAELTNAIDFGSIAFAQTGGAFGTPQGSDGKVELTADDWSYGWNIGLLYEFSENTRVGLSYRSDIDYTVEGDADFFVPSVITGVPLIDAGIAAQFASTEAEADITLPGSASLSGYHRINPQWAVMADITWTNWSEFDELRVEFDPNLFGLTLSDNVTTHDWDDSWRYSAGAVYNHNENLAFRLGVAYDETPIPDEEHRTPRVPGEDRVWTAIGLGYAFNDSVSIDWGYVHLFVDDADINRQAGTDPNGEDFFRGSLVGEFEHSVDIISAQIAITF